MKRTGGDIQSAVTGKTGASPPGAGDVDHPVDRRSVVVEAGDVGPGQTVSGPVGDAGQLAQPRPGQMTALVQLRQQASHPLACRVTVLIGQPDGPQEFVVGEVVGLPVEQRRELCQPVGVHAGSLRPGFFRVVKRSNSLLVALGSAAAHFSLMVTDC